MSEPIQETAATAPPETTEKPETKPTETVEFWKQKAREQEARAKANAKAAERLNELEEQNKTDLQKEQERAAAAERRAVEAEAKALRAEVAAEKGVPLALLAGSTREEMEAAADALLAFRGDVKPPTPPTVSVLTPGNGSVAEKSVAAGAAMFRERHKPTTNKE